MIIVIAAVHVHVHVNVNVPGMVRGGVLHTFKASTIRVCSSTQSLQQRRLDDRRLTIADSEPIVRSSSCPFRL